ncbi:MAG: FHA domain-containing protein [Planctomycetes bacterium]|nr:FHA domain-containing protein [Planctomycetota bacterium]
MVRPRRPPSLDRAERAAARALAAEVDRARVAIGKALSAGRWTTDGSQAPPPEEGGTSPAGGGDTPDLAPDLADVVHDLDARATQVLVDLWAARFEGTLGRGPALARDLPGGGPGAGQRDPPAAARPARGARRGPRPPPAPTPAGSDGDLDAAFGELEAGDEAAPAARDDAASFQLAVTSPEGESSVHDFDQDVVTIGRDPGCALVLDSMLVSRRHAEVRRNDAFLAVVDLGTANGTFLNGKRVGGLTLLNDGDVIVLGKFQVKVRATSARGFAGLPETPVGDEGDDRLGGMTLQLSPEVARRAAEEAGRVRGHVVVPKKGAADLRLFVSETFLVGKGAGCDLSLNGWLVPKKVAMFVRGSDRYLLVNLSDSPRVLVNDRPVSGRVVLADGDRVELYGHRLGFSQPGA